MPIASGSYGRLADEIQVNFKKLLHIEMLEFLLHLTKAQHYYSSTNAFKLLKPIVRWFLKVNKIQKPYTFIVIPTISQS